MKTDHLDEAVLDDVMYKWPLHIQKHQFWLYELIFFLPMGVAFLHLTTNVNISPLCRKAIMLNYNAAGMNTCTCQHTL